MPNIHPITPERYKNKCWKQNADFAFAAGEMHCPLTAGEIVKASLTLPVAFVKSGEQWLPTALLGYETGRNLLVGKDGQWVAKYKPAAFRAYPFMLAEAEDSRRLVCFDEDSGLLSDEGTAFFDDDSGNASEELKEVMEFLSLYENGRLTALSVCERLVAENLIVPWEVELVLSKGNKKLTGLYKIDEGLLNELPAETLASLRDCGALTMAYAQMFSMLNLQSLVNFGNALDAVLPGVLRKTEPLVGVDGQAHQHPNHHEKAHALRKTKVVRNAQREAPEETHRDGHRWSQHHERHQVSASHVPSIGNIFF